MLAFRDDSRCLTLTQAKLSRVNSEELVDALLDERMHIPPLPSLSPVKRCLLVLDLNGTLLHRRRTNSGANSHVYVRPYLGAFLRYISHPAAALDVAVWSSARRENVEIMVDRAWTGAGAAKSASGSTDERLGRVRFPDLVFAREDMLLTERQFNHNVRTTKDLRQLWLRLAQLRDQRLRAQEQQQLQQAQYSPAGPSTPAVRSPEVLDHALHGPRDTILLDDSAHKARLQPDNHLSLPTYGAAQLRADANSLISLAPTTTDQSSPQVDEALLAVVGILSELRDGTVDDWMRTGRVWSGPGAQLDPHEMWAHRRIVALPSTATSSSPRSRTSDQTLTNRLLSRPSRFESTLTLDPHEPDPPFAPTDRPTLPAEMPQWFSSPPLVRAWVEHGRRVLSGLGIQAEHECVQAWPGWREGKTDIKGHAKDDVRSSASTHKAKKGTDKSRRLDSSSRRGGAGGGQGLAK